MNENTHKISQNKMISVAVWADYSAVATTDGASLKAIVCYTFKQKYSIKMLLTKRVPDTNKTSTYPFILSLYLAVLLIPIFQRFCRNSLVRAMVLVFGSIWRDCIQGYTDCPSAGIENPLIGHSFQTPGIISVSYRLCCAFCVRHPREDSAMKSIVSLWSGSAVAQHFTCTWCSW